jgi:hypothetical protein
MNSVQLPVQITDLSSEFNQRCMVVLLKCVLLFLDRGSIIPCSQQILKYHHHLKYTDRQLTNVLTALEGAPAAAPHSIALQFLEKKLYLNFLNTAEMNISDLKHSLG